MNKLIASPIFQTNWIVPRNIMCALFWTGVFVVFMGMILLVTGKHRGTAFLSWGSVVLGLGLCVLLVCLMLCIHAYCVVANASRTDEEFETYDPPAASGNQTSNMEADRRQYAQGYTTNLPQGLTMPPKFKNKVPTVRFNLIDQSDDFEVAHFTNARTEAQKISRETELFNDPPKANHVPKVNHRSFSVEIRQTPKREVSPLVIHRESEVRDDGREVYLSHHSVNDSRKFKEFPVEGLLDDDPPNMSITRNFGASTITVTPIQRNNYHLIRETSRSRYPENVTDRSRLNAIRSGRIVTGSQPGFTPIFPESPTSTFEELNINETELNRYPMNEIADSKATVYDNVQYYHV